MNSPTIVVYAKANCPWGAAIKAFLAAQGIPFEDKTIDRSAEDRRELVDISGRSLSPTVVVGNIVLPDASVEDVASEILETTEAILKA